MALFNLLQESFLFPPLFFDLHAYSYSHQLPSFRLSCLAYLPHRLFTITPPFFMHQLPGTSLGKRMWSPPLPTAFFSIGLFGLSFFFPSLLLTLILAYTSYGDGHPDRSPSI